MIERRARKSSYNSPIRLFRSASLDVCARSRTASKAFQALPTISSAVATDVGSMSESIALRSIAAVQPGKRCRYQLGFGCRICFLNGKIGQPHCATGLVSFWTFPGNFVIDQPQLLWRNCGGLILKDLIDKRGGRNGPFDVQDIGRMVLRDRERCPISDADDYDQLEVLRSWRIPLESCLHGLFDIVFTRKNTELA